VTNKNENVGFRLCIEKLIGKKTGEKRTGQKGLVKFVIHITKQRKKILSKEENVGPENSAKMKKFLHSGTFQREIL